MNSSSLAGDSPSLRRWLQEHPHLEPEVRSVLRAGEAVRSVRVVTESMRQSHQGVYKILI